MMVSVTVSDTSVRCQVERTMSCKSNDEASTAGLYKHAHQTGHCKKKWIIQFLVHTYNNAFSTLCKQQCLKLTPKTVKSKSWITQIICQRIQDRRMGLQHWKQASPCALDSLWRGTISLFSHTDHKCFQEAVGDLKQYLIRILVINWDKCNSGQWPYNKLSTDLGLA